MKNVPLLNISSSRGDLPRRGTMRAPHRLIVKQDYAVALSPLWKVLGLLSLGFVLTML